MEFSVPKEFLLRCHALSCVAGRTDFSEASGLCLSELALGRGPWLSSWAGVLPQLQQEALHLVPASVLAIVYDCPIRIVFNGSQKAGGKQVGPLYLSHKIPCMSFAC